MRLHCSSPKNQPHLMLFSLDVGATAQTHPLHLGIFDTVARRVEMLGHRKSRSVLAYASQMLTKSTSEASPSLPDVPDAAGYVVHEIFRHACKMLIDGKGAFRTWYLGERIDVLAGVVTRALTCT